MILLLTKIIWSQIIRNYWTWWVNFDTSLHRNRPIQIFLANISFHLLRLISNHCFISIVVLVCCSCSCGVFEHVAAWHYSFEQSEMTLDETVLRYHLIMWHLTWLQPGYEHSNGVSNLWEPMCLLIFSPLFSHLWHIWHWKASLLKDIQLKRSNLSFSFSPILLLGLASFFSLIISLNIPADS